MANLLRVAPEIPVADILKSTTYYVDKLGFETVMTMPAGDYAIVERDGVALHLFKAAAGTAPVAMHIFAEGLDDLHSEMRRRGAAVTQGVVRQPWGNRDFRVEDDFGNELKFTEPSSAN